MRRSGYNLTCGSPTSAPFLQFKTLAEAEKLWQQAEHAVAGDEELLARVRLGHLPVRYVWLARWDALRTTMRCQPCDMAVAEFLSEVAEEWRDVANGVPGKPWTKVSSISEGGTTPEQFLFATSGKDTLLDKLPERTVASGRYLNMRR